MPKKEKTESNLPDYINNFSSVKVEPVDYITRKTISYTQFSMYSGCPYQWYLTYVKKLAPPSISINMTFGTAIHETIQEYLKIMFSESGAEADRWDSFSFFQERFLKLYQDDKEKNKEHFSTPTELKEFIEDGLAIIDFFKKNRNSYFTKSSQVLLGIEIPVNIVPTVNPNVYFYGKLDLVIYDSFNNRVKIIDIKTSTAGWNKYQKADKVKLRQLPLYKKFFSEQYGVPIDNIETEYFIVKRKINENAEFAAAKRRVQIFNPPSGKTTINQITADLNNFIKTCFTEGEYNTNADYFKNTSNCKYCPFNNNTELCDKSTK
jgi:hypothetical protein